MKDRFAGCLLGLAVGDALGQPIEAFPPDRLKREYGEIRDFMDGDPRLPLPLKAGQWTDDTQMTLDITRSIIRQKRVDPEDIAREFVLDHETEGIRFSGFAVTYALKRLRKGIPWERSGLDDEQSAGNGSAMRVAPVGLLHTLNPDAAEKVKSDAMLSSIVTHRHPEAVAGAQAVAFIVWQAARGTLTLNTAIDEAVELIGPCRLANNLFEAKALLANGTDTETSLAKLGTTGFVVHTVASALFCFLKTPRDFERSVIDAVMGGDDADTTAAITGAMSGAYNGLDAIPNRWRENVEAGPDILSLGHQLFEVASQFS